MANNFSPQATTDSVADRIVLHRQDRQTPVIIVEGGPDKRFLHRMFEAAGPFDVFPAGPRPLALKAAYELADRGLGRWMCLIDRDFDDVVGVAQRDGLPVVCYDGADLEGMLVGTAALEDWLGENASETKLAKLGGAIELRERIFEALMPMQRLRAANAKFSWGLDFTSIDLRRKVKKDDLSLAAQSLCDSLWHADLDIEKATLYSAAQSYEVSKCPSTGLVLVRGKDAVAFFGVALRRLVGGLSHQATEPDKLSRDLRLAARTSHLSTTNWHREVAAFLAQ